MKKQALFLLLAAVGLTAFAQVSIKIVPAADVHNGAAAGDPAGFINEVDNKLDVTGMAKDDMLVFDIILENFEFNLAGYEYKINFPSQLTKMSVTDTDWNTGVGAVYKAAGLTAAGSTQFLPADQNGDLTADTVDNGEGTVRVGMLWTNPDDRPLGSVGTPNAGGVIGRVAFMYNRNGCDSSHETISVYLTSSGSATDADIFADHAALRQVVASSSVTVAVGNTSSRLRGDFNKNGSRTPGDALGAARCALYGQANCTGWTGDTAAQFKQGFDFNCSDSVTPGDALGMARLCLGLQNRTASKNAFNVALDGQPTSMVIKNNALMASQQVVTLKLNNVKVTGFAIDQEAQKAGWTILEKIGGEFAQYMLLHPEYVDARIPEVTMTLQSGDKAELQVYDVFTQSTDYQTLQDSLQIDTPTSLEKPVKPGLQFRQ
jgi:hypothetical protein